MLSEVWQLVKALEKAGIATEKTHPRVNEPGRTTGPCLRVRLKADGQVGAIEGVTDDDWPGLWTVMEGNMNSFPVMRLTQPLLRLPHNHDGWTQLGYDQKGTRAKKTKPGPEKAQAILKDVWDRTEHRGATEAWDRMREKAGELGSCAEGNTPAAQVLRDFGKRFAASAKDPEQLLRQIGESCLTTAEKGRLRGSAWDAVEALLVGTKPPTQPDGDAETKVQLAFDLDNDDLPIRFYSSEVRGYLMEVLPVDADRSDPSQVPVVQCSLSGQEGASQDRPFTKVRLPVLNKAFPLFSMFSDAACNTRHGLTDSMAIPVTRSTDSRLANALKTITLPSRQGYTWRSVASGKFERRSGRTVEKSDLLIVYPEAKPDIAERVADIFGNDEQTIERQFDADTKTVCKALDGIARANPASRLQLFVIRKVSEGQAQIAIAESPTVLEVLEAARRWSEGATNVPEIVIPLPPAERAQPPREGRPRTPFPDEVVRLLAEQWMNEGRKSAKIQGVGLGDVLHLMLRTPGKWQVARDRMLNLLLQRLATLLLGVSNATSKKTRDAWKEFPTGSRLAGLRAVSLAGILLGANNRYREVYMTSAAFDIGQMLKLADILHKDYCVVVRKGSIPPSLIGNAMMPRAFDNPREAVADLADRMRVYAGWAKTARDPRTGAENDPTLIAVREARKTLRRFEPLAARLKDSGLPEGCDDVMKAEMLLGYLAKAQETEINNKEAINE